MNMTMLAMLNGWEIVLILAVVLILFGAKKLPELAKGLGQGIKDFKKASSEVTSELQRAADVDDYAQRQVRYNAPEKTVEASQDSPAAASTNPQNPPKA